jgi:hypothetical protein
MVETLLDRDMQRSLSSCFELNRTRYSVQMVPVAIKDSKQSGILRTLEEFMYGSDIPLNVLHLSIRSFGTGRFPANLYIDLLTSQCKVVSCRCCCCDEAVHEWFMPSTERAASRRDTISDPHSTSSWLSNLELVRIPVTSCTLSGYGLSCPCTRLSVLVTFSHFFMSA